MGSLYHGSMANRKAKTNQFLLNMREWAAKASIEAANVVRSKIGAQSFTIETKPRGVEF
jgi:hypothetical protein